MLNFASLALAPAVAGSYLFYLLPSSDILTNRRLLGGRRPAGLIPSMVFRARESSIGA